jgi:hypothetical protein
MRPWNHIRRIVLVAAILPMATPLWAAQRVIDPNFRLELESESDSVDPRENVSSARRTTSSRRTWTPRFLRVFADTERLPSANVRAALASCQAQGLREEYSFHNGLGCPLIL